MIETYESKPIVTDRLILKKGLLEDYLSVYEYDFRKLRNIDNEFKFCKTDLNEIQKWFEPSIKQYYLDSEKNHMFDWLIYLKKTNLPIGNLTADRENIERKEIEIAFNLHPNYWGNGYMPEAVISVMQYFFEIGYENIVCGYDEGNIKSKKVIEKIGFEEFEYLKAAWIKNGKPISSSVKTVFTKEKWLSNSVKK